MFNIYLIYRHNPFYLLNQILWLFLYSNIVLDIHILQLKIKISSTIVWICVLVQETILNYNQYLLSE